MKQIRLFILPLFFWACSSTPKSDEKLSPENTALNKCYGAYTDQDSVFVRLTFVGDEVTGDLVYKLYEKDKNQGTIHGVVNGDTILATYQFMSEGQTSTREVAFLKQGNDLVEGFAPMDESGTHFQNKHDLDFAGILLQADACRE